MLPIKLFGNLFISTNVVIILTLNTSEINYANLSLIFLNFYSNHLSRTSC